MTVYSRYDTASKLFTDDSIRCGIPLLKLTNLDINAPTIPLTALVEILKYTPNIHTLALTMIKTVPKEFLHLEENATFQLVSCQNKIKSLTFKRYYALHMTKILLNLCQQLEQIAFGVYAQSVEAVVKYLLSKRDESICNLFSVCIFGLNEMWFIKLQSLIDSNTLPDDYLTQKIVNDKLYLRY